MLVWWLPRTIVIDILAIVGVMRIGYPVVSNKCLTNLRGFRERMGKEVARNKA